MVRFDQLDSLCCGHSRRALLYSFQSLHAQRRGVYSTTGTNYPVTTQQNTGGKGIGNQWYSSLLNNLETSCLIPFDL